MTKFEISALLTWSVFRCFAVAPVALSLTNAADYVSSRPANSNLIVGVGMGKDGAYRTVRAEDAEFLTTAILERLLFASGSGDRYADAGGGAEVKYIGMMPNRVWRFEDAEGMISNSFPVTWGTPIPPFATTIRGRYGFVPDSFKIWDGFAPSSATNDWVRNGFYATNDIHAVFALNASGFPASEIPFSLTNLFRHIPTFSSITNAYAVLSSGLCSNLLATARVDDYYSQTTNQYKIASGEHQAVAQYYTEPYDYGDSVYLWTTSVVLRSVAGTETLYRRTIGASMQCEASRQVSYDTPFSVRRTGATSGYANFFQPFKAGDSSRLSIPSNGTPWTVSFALVSGKLPDYMTAYNTNLVVAAHLCSLWEFISTEARSRDLGLGDGYATTLVTTKVDRAISSYPLGQLVLDPRHVEFSINTYGLWSSNGDFEGFGTTVADVQKAVLGVSGSFFDTGDFLDLEPANPETVLPTDYPSVFTNGWERGALVYGRGVTIRTHIMQSVLNFAVLIVNPVYNARVLGELQEN